MTAFVVRRVLAAVLFVLVVSSGALVLVRMAPGDATSDLFLSGADPAAVEAARHRLGLDQSVTVQLKKWLQGVATLDLGVSSRYGRPVADLVADRAGNTALLAALALVVATLIGLPIGILTGSRPTSRFAMIVTWLSVAFVACPPIVGTLGLLLLAVETGWLSIAPGSLAVPTLALALPLAAMLERLQAQAIAEAVSSPDLVAGAARGLSRGRLLWMHAARQSLRPVLGVYGIVIGSLFSGSIAVETMTAWPGLGRLMLDGLVSRDIFLVAGCAMAGAVLIAAGNFIADVVRAAVDPRMRGYA